MRISSVSLAITSILASASCMAQAEESQTVEEQVANGNSGGSSVSVPEEGLTIDELINLIENAPPAEGPVPDDSDNEEAAPESEGEQSGP